MKTQKNLQIVLGLVISLLVSSVLFFANSALAADRVIDDFENGKLPTGKDADKVGIGFITWSDGSPVAITTTTIATGTALALPGQGATNTVLKLDGKINSWGGFTHAFENATADTWVSQDWSTNEGVSFWLYGNNTSNGLFFELKDNRNPGATKDDAETWTYPFKDDFTGWKQFKVPFESFTRKDIGNGAPDDGFGLNEMHGWDFGLATNGVNQTYYLDNISVYGNVIREKKLEVIFAAKEYAVNEGGIANVTVKLSMVSTGTVTVGYASKESNAEVNIDYKPVTGVLTFPPNTTQQTFTVTTFADGKYDLAKRVVLLLSNPQVTAPLSATLGFQRRAVLVINETDPENLALLDDFEESQPFTMTGAVTLAAQKVVTGATGLPGQKASEGVVKANYTGAGEFYRTFPQAQDWSNREGLSFWVNGSNSGNAITVKVQDNQTATTGAVAPANWVLRWSDEFNDAAGTPPNPNVWTPEISDGAVGVEGNIGWGNSELEYYTDKPENVSTDGNGNLVIRVSKVDTGTSQLWCHYGACEYTSARLVSKDKAEFQYGKIEARAKVAAGEGLWPAIWTLGENFPTTAWPTSGEIDIMEFVGKDPMRVFGTIHGPGYSGGGGIVNTYSFSPTAVYNGYHTYTVEWTPGKIDWYVDNIKYHSATTATIPTGTQWVYDHPFFLILNQAIGGNFGGTVGKDVVFPADMLVDYIRVYQAPDTAERYEASFTDDFTGWKLITVSFKSMIRSANQPTNAPNDGLGLKQIWGYGLATAAGKSGSFQMDQASLYGKIGGTPAPVLPIVDNFELDTLPKGKDGTMDVGYVTWGNSANTNLSLVSVPSGDALARPGQTAATKILKAEYNVTQYGGFTHAFQNDAGSKWVSQDWTAYAGMSFWLYGAKTDKQIQVEIFDNRSVGSTADDAERWYYRIDDNFTGWLKFTIPFTDFKRRTDWQPPNAPNDTLGLTQVWGYTFGFPTDTGSKVNYFDEVILYKVSSGEVPGTTTVDNFEVDTLPKGKDGTMDVGFSPWSGATMPILSVVTVAKTDPLARPEQAATNKILKVEYDISNYGGFTHAFENETATKWISKDWTAYKGLSFWFYGANSGGQVQVDLFDNRDETATADSAERWYYRFDENFTGWKQFSIPFTDFKRRTDWQPSGAPDDGLGLNKVSGYAFGLPTGKRTNYVDEVTLYGGEVPYTMIDDFESGISPEIILWSGDDDKPTLTQVDGPVPLPGQTTATKVLSVTYNTTNYEGFTHAFAKSADWSSYEGFSFWFYGMNTGVKDIRVEFKDGGPGVTGEGNAEIFAYYFNDDFSGWKQFKLPWSSFPRRADYNPGPNDGMSLKEIWGYAIGTDGAKKGSYYLDNVALYGKGGGTTPTTQDVTLNFAKSFYAVNEGETANIGVTIDVTATKEITVNYTIAAGTATDGKDYTATAGMLTFKAGSLPGSVQTITVKVLTDTESEVAETVAVALAETSGKLGKTASAKVVINAHGLDYLNSSLSIDKRVSDLLSRMTVKEKVGQMTQIDHSVLQGKPEVIATTYLGSLLSGGGGAPSTGNTAKDWADMYDKYQAYALSTRLQIPLIYGVDAVHGHNNVYGATVFPHNIGLGATRNPMLAEKIGRVTAFEVVATGIDWTFAPCVCVSRDERWGRTYESFGEDPEIAAMMSVIVRGYQGKKLSDPGSVLATAKHFVGDGGTTGGKNEGLTEMTEADLRTIHLAPYIPAIDKYDVGSIMPSYSSVRFTDKGETTALKMHAHKYLLSDVLKGELGFDGFLISDWAAIDQIPGDYNSDVRTSINAGLDMIMVPGDYDKFTVALLNEIAEGNIPQSRIDDAVRRILVKKFELGLFEKPFTDRSFLSQFGSAEHRAVARQAVRESLVLLKNDKNILPLPKTGKTILVAGKNADDLGNQMGGWSIAWQGKSGKISEGTTILEGLKHVAPNATITFNKEATGTLKADLGIVVVGEIPYAETAGDAMTAEKLSLSAEDKSAVKNVCAAMDCVVVLISGRPLLINDELASAKAFVAAWLPGSEGAGVADVLFGDAAFRGKLPMTWPKSFDQLPINKGDGKEGLFAYGFGLTYQSEHKIPTGGVDKLVLLGGITVTLPSGTFDAEVTLKYTPKGGVVTGTLRHVGIFYAIDAVDSTGKSIKPKQKYTIVVRYNPATLPSDVDQTTLALYYQDASGKWVKEASSKVDTVANTVTAEVDHFSEYAILAEETATTGGVYLPIIVK